MTDQDVKREIIAAVEEIVRHDMEPHGLRSVAVTPGVDHDGDPALLITVEYGLDGRPIEPKVVANLVTKVRSRLWELGEERFPHFRHHFSERQKVAGYS